MRYCCVKGINCEYANSCGWCTISACMKHSNFAKTFEWNHVHSAPVEINGITCGEAKNAEDILIFPLTIGNITFKSKKELIDWVWMHQDEDYGRGNNA